MADKFELLVKKHGCAPSRYVDTGWIVVESAIDGKAKRTLMSEWCKISMEDNSKPNNQKELKL